MTLATHDVRWGAGGKLIVDGVTLEVEPNRVLGLIGPNGSGKSSLLRLLCRLRKVASGVVTLDGEDIAGVGRRDLARRLAFVEQQATTEIALTVCDVVRLGRTPHRAAFAAWSAEDEHAVDAALERVGLSERHDQLWHTLSGGERQRVHIARALAQAPRELILDEPTNHLDIQHQLSILRLVRRLGVTCIVALHDLNLASLFCDRIGVLAAGRLVAAGAPEEVLTPALIRDVFGVEVAIRAGANGRRQIDYLVDHEPGEPL
ncbi:ABC transporter ATP-binding protein [Ancylobacter polymorphus]|uniref:Iron complex transport system ATP-binding protein n=1 Tax=Ancylobacter polymorphus TaxID=223390 RepID=A0ABU0B7A8_9HYPH|nr:ABC transporter ATP-binding protein [Ancylobacter polymorphus]MDQ0301711.1 iron complex transport system ATP-binding protein [Ancylobacter polymorphus]